MAEDGPVWDAIGELRQRATNLERSLDGHLGECRVRHEEIRARQVEAQGDRSTLRVEMHASAAETRNAITALSAETRRAIEASAKEAQREIEDTRKALERGKEKHAGLGWAIAGGTITLAVGIVLKLMKLI